jgi:PKD repeat protein
LFGSGEIIEYNLPAGVHNITLVVTDNAGASDSNEVTITVVDVTPPVFSLSVEPNVLWPVNHKMFEITPSWIVSDNCDEDVQVSLVDITIEGEGNTGNDIFVDPNDGSIWLRAERNGKGVGPSTPLRAGRIYTITYQAVDDSNNVAVDSAAVIVPHDRR